MGKLIFILIDGLRCDAAFRHMGFLEHMTEMGAAARYRVRAELPTMSRPLYETLMTGLPVLEHGIYSNEIKRLSKEENLFGLAAGQGLVTAASAYCWFSELYNSAPFNPITDRMQLCADRPIQNGLFYFQNGGGPYPDSHVVADAEALRVFCSPDFLLVHTMNTDDAGHAYGGESSEYVKAVIGIDYILANFIPLWLQSGYQILVTADHGFNRWGWHGGNGEEERMVPLYLLSPDAPGGDYTDNTLSQLAVAPLCCALLGIDRGKKMTPPEIPGLRGSAI